MTMSASSTSPGFTRPRSGHTQPSSTTYDVGNHQIRPPRRRPSHVLPCSRSPSSSCTELPTDISTSPSSSVSLDDSEASSATSPSRPKPQQSSSAPEFNTNSAPN
ncbi:hypothetical protein Droror1_Dr00010894 [Drosera rotundifolia]